MLFLQETVINRPLRTKRSQQAQTTIQGDKIVPTLSARTVNTYAAALISLYYTQKSLGINTHSHPRGAKLKALLNDHSLKEFVRRKAEFIDRGASTLQDGYSLIDFENIVRSCWAIADIRSAPTNQTIEAYFRTALDFLLSHNMLLRGENRRAAELADLFVLPLVNEGPTACPAMIMIIGNGKTNYLNKLEYGVTVRHRNPLLCTLAHTAFYLFYRWDCVREPPPQFQRRQQWYDIHLIKGYTPTTGVSYGVQLEWTNRMFKAARIGSLKKTHAGRSRSAQYAELAGVSEAQIRRAGRWNNDALTNCYLSHIPLEFVRSMAGFPPTQAGNYYLPRAKVHPPESLLQAVWPWVDQWQTWFRTKHGKLTERPLTSYDQIFIEPGAEEHPEDLAAQGFLRLLAELRIIFLQDSVFFKREFPDHPLWHHSLFVRSDYQEFAQEVLQSINEVEEPASIRLRTVVPDIATQLNLTREDIVRTVDNHGHRTYGLLQTVNRYLEDFLTGKFTFKLQASSLAPLTNQTENPSESSTVPSTQSLRTRIDQETSEVAPSEPFQLDPDIIFPYSMCRALVSVYDLWKEWNVGLNGSPSIQALERTYGAKWRQSSMEKMFFGRRKVIVNEIYRQFHLGGPIETAIEQVELVRKRERLTLHGLSGWLKKQNIVRNQGGRKGKT